MRRLLILLLLFVLVGTAMAKLSDETLEEVEKLSYKHYGHGTSLSGMMVTTTDLDIVYEWWNITFDDDGGILYVETQDGKWFIEMEKVREGD